MRVTASKLSCVCSRSATDCPRSCSTRPECGSANSRRSSGATSTSRGSAGVSQAPCPRPAALAGVPVPPELFEAVTRLVAREDPVPERSVFQGFGGDRFLTAVARACTAAGVPAFSPHGFRHRRVSLLHLGGMPCARIGEPRRLRRPPYNGSNLYARRRRRGRGRLCSARTISRRRRRFVTTARTPPTRHAQLGRLLRDLIHSSPQIVKIILGVPARSKVRRMQRELFVDLATDRRPVLGGSAVLFRPLAEAEERLKTCKNGCKHAEHSDCYLKSGVDVGPGKRRENARPDDGS